MNQSTVLGGALLAGFALYLAAQNRLSDYGRVLWGAKPASHSATPETQADTGTGSIVGPGSILDDFGPNLDVKGLLGLPDVPLIPDLGAYGF